MDRYADVHQHARLNGPGDERPTALQIIRDEHLENAMADKIFFVTGCSSGIGVETARALKATGAKVYATARDLVKGREALKDVLEPGRVMLFELDLNSLDSVRKCAAEFLAEEKKLNVLICNAGVMAVPTLEKTKDGFERQIGTNHFAHFLLFQLLKPALLAGSTPEFQSRVVTLSSSGHRISGIVFDDINLEGEGRYDPWLAYGQSKTADIYMATEIDRRYGPQGIHANSVHPGGIWSGLQKYVDIRQWTENEDLAPHVAKGMKSTEQGAATTVWAAVAKVWEGRGGQYLEECQPGKPMRDGAGMFEPGYASWVTDGDKARRLWDVSLKMVGVADDESAQG